MARWVVTVYITNDTCKDYANLSSLTFQGGGNPFDMKNLMESVKKAQAMVQQETARVQQELAK